MRTRSDSVNKIDAVSDVRQSIGISMEFEISQLLGVPLKTHVLGPRLDFFLLTCLPLPLLAMADSSKPAQAAIILEHDQWMKRQERAEQ